MANTDVRVVEYTREALNQLRDVLASANRGGSAASTGSSTDPLDEHTEATEDNTDAVRNQTTGFRRLRQDTVKLRKAFGHFKSAASNLSPLLDEFKSGISGGVEAVDGLEGYVNRTSAAFKDLGISIVSLHEFNKVARAASINMGGFDAWSVKLASRQRQYYELIGDNTEATKHQVMMQDMLIHSGVNANDFYSDFGDQLRTTNIDLLKMGVSIEESRSHLIGMTKEDAVRQRLMSAAGEKQRRQIMLEMQARFANYTAMGMSTEQAEAASKALEAISGKGPLERFKTAAKMQAGMSAMGVENAAEVANIIRKGDRASDAERETARKAWAQIEERGAEARMGGIGTEFTYEAIFKATGLDELPKVFSTKLTENAAISKEQRDAIKMLGKDTKELTTIAQTLDKINTFLTKSWLASAPAIMKDIAVGVVSLVGLTKLGNIALQGMRGASGSLAGARGGPGMLKAGVVTAAAAYGIQQAYQAITTGDSDIENVIESTLGEDRWARWGDNFFGAVDHVLGAFGNDASAERVATADRLEKMEEIQAMSAAEAADEAEELRGDVKKMTDSIVKLAKQMQGQSQYNQQSTAEQIRLLSEQKTILEEQLAASEQVAGNTKSQPQLKGGRNKRNN